MNTSLDGGFAVMPRREAPSVAAVTSTAATATAAAPQTGAAAVPPPQSSQQGAGAKSNAERARASTPASAQDQAAKATAPSDAVTVYQNRFSYEREYNRVFLDIVDPSRDEVVMRIPSEQLAKYLREVTSDCGGSAPCGVDQLA